MSKRKRKPDDEPSKGLYIINVQYLCGSEVGFATTDGDKAAAMAARIMTDICPECKLEAGMPITDDERDMLIVGKSTTTSHEKAKQN